MSFCFSKHLDGTYSIVSRASNDACFVEVEAASKTAGANVQQWAPTNSTCQRWNLLTEALPEPTEPTTMVVIPPPIIMGDVDGDLKVGVSDIIMLQKWLLAVPGAGLTVPECGYINDDGVIDVFDLALLKRMVLNA